MLPEVGMQNSKPLNMRPIIAHCGICESRESHKLPALYLEGPWEMLWIKMYKRSRNSSEAHGVNLRSLQ
jgi:hypothetical protein